MRPKYDLPDDKRDYVAISTTSLVTGCIAFVLLVTAFSWAIFQIYEMKQNDEKQTTEQVTP